MECIYLAIKEGEFSSTVVCKFLYAPTIQDV